MQPLPESTINLLLSGLMGMFGGFVTIPFNAVFSLFLKRDELKYQHKLNLIAKQRELLLQHQLEMERKDRDNEMAALRAAVKRLEERLSNE